MSKRWSQSARRPLGGPGPVIKQAVARRRESSEFVLSRFKLSLALMVVYSLNSFKSL